MSYPECAGTWHHDLLPLQPLGAGRVLFSLMLSRWVDWQAAGKSLCGLYLRDIGWAYSCAMSWHNLDLTFDLSVLMLTLKIMS